MRSKTHQNLLRISMQKSQYEFVPGFFCFTVCFVTTFSRHGLQRSRIIVISCWAPVLFCLFTFRFLLLKRALKPAADLIPSALLRTTPPWDSHRVRWCGTRSHLRESPMRTINWDILCWSFANAAWLQTSRPPRPTGNKGRERKAGNKLPGHPSLG